MITPTENDYLKERLGRLKEFTEDCREDMHEPDEQGIEAIVLGNHLDNAFGEQIGVEGLERGYHEFVVILRNTKTDKDMRINLATLIALARRAVDDEELEKHLPHYNHSP